MMNEENKARTTCNECGQDIYEGEIFYTINGENICVDCLGDFAEKWFQAFLRVAGDGEP